MTIRILNYEQLDALLDQADLMQEDWVTSLQNIRELSDHAYNAGALADYEWKALVTRSALIQDMKNGD